MKFLFFTKWSSFKNYEKLFKFVYFRLPLFFSVSAIALQVDPRSDNETLSLDRVLNKEHFYRKIMQRMYTKR